MTPQEDFETFLATHAPLPLAERPSDEPHLDAERLARLPDDALDDTELEHLAGCAECRAVVAQVVRVARPTRTPIVAAMAVAASVAVAMLTLPALLEDEPMRPRGAETEHFEAPQTVVLVDDAEGRRIATDGERTTLGARLGFRYGNVGGHAKTVTILGWDGHNVHWYYPEAPDAPPPALKSGPRAVNVRLEYEMKLDAPHRPGPLWIVVAYDADPRALARTLETRGTRGIEGDVHRIAITERRAP